LLFVFLLRGVGERAAAEQRRNGQEEEEGDDDDDGQRNRSSHCPFHTTGGHSAERVTIPDHRRYRNPEYYFLINIESVMQ
jgi:hypothetical protein